MNNFVLLAGLLLVILCAFLIILFSTKRFKNQTPAVFRKITPILKLRRAMGLAVEDGTRVHVSLGNASITDPTNTSGFVGLSTLNRIGQLTSTSDQPPVVTSGSGGLLLLSQDVLQATSRETNTRELYDPYHAQMAGVTPLSYAVGAMETMSQPGVNANVLIGHFGSEIGLLCDQSNQQNALSVAGSDSLTAQSVMYAAADQPLIGEELYALPAYLQYNQTHIASIRTQDILRFVVEICLVGGAVLTLLGIL